MRQFFGLINEVRDDPIAPVLVDFDMGDGVVTEWIPVDVASWAACEYSALEKGGVECIVFEVPHEQYPYRVGQIFPSAAVVLPANRKRIARVGDAVGIRGTVTVVTLGIPATVGASGRIT